MLLHDLTIENFRSFEKYKLDKLARVNLLVGDNNWFNDKPCARHKSLRCKENENVVKSF